MKVGTLFAIMFLMAACLFVMLGCATKPEPVIITKEVKVAVPTPCKPDLGPRPQLLTREQLKTALIAAPSLDDRAKIIADQLLKYMGWTPIVEAGLKGCEGAQIPPVG